MNIPEINYWAVALATIVAMVIGAAWYSQAIVGARWIRLAKIDPEKRPGASRALALIASTVSTFLTVWVLAGAIAIAWHFYGGSFLVSALVTGVTLWAGFTAARFITHDVFEGRASQLTVLNIAHELVMVIAISLILGAWAPTLSA